MEKKAKYITNSTLMKIPYKELEKCNKSSNKESTSIKGPKGKTQ